MKLVKNMKLIRLRKMLMTTDRILHFQNHLKSIMEVNFSSHYLDKRESENWWFLWFSNASFVCNMISLFKSCPLFFIWSKLCFSNSSYQGLHNRSLSNFYYNGRHLINQTNKPNNQITLTDEIAYRSEVILLSF